MPSLVDLTQEETKTLRGPQAREVLDVIGFLKHKRGVARPGDAAAEPVDSDDDWAAFERLAGAWSGTFNRAEALRMTDFTIHPQLLTDCHVLGRLSATHLLLHRNAAVPWFILVPEIGLLNLLDLPEAQRNAVLADCTRVSDWLTGARGCARVNVAWIGNLVPQLHVHVIGRSPGDPCWPRPVWGHLEAGRAYEPAELASIAAGVLGRGPLTGRA